MAVHHAELFMHIDQDELVLVAAAFQAAFEDAAIGQIEGEHGREAEIALLLFDPEGDSAGWAEHLNHHPLGDVHVEQVVKALYNKFIK